MTTTNIIVRVIANDGKFLGDDIGGAYITIRDAETREILIQGPTSGGSGPNGSPTDPNAGVMCAQLKRGEPIPMDKNTANFTTSLDLSAPRRIEVTAFGPLAARASAQTVSLTTWLFPGKHMDKGNGILLELSGLLCQVIDPPAHHPLTQPPPATVPITANIAMMCGCPISDKPQTPTAICPCDQTQPWLPQDFDVGAVVTSSVLASPITTPLTWSNADTPPVPGKFVGSVDGSKLQTPGSYLVTVYAQQVSTGNTGVDFATWVVPPPPPSKPSC